MNPGKSGAEIPIASQERLVNEVNDSIDIAIADELDRLRREEGVVPTCKAGCSHCCRYHILINIAEARTLAQTIKREWSADQIDGLRIRTQRWHVWEDSRPGRYPSADIDESLEFSTYNHSCPLLVNDVCSVYSVRPVVCRRHFVSSPSQHCFAANDPKSTEDSPVVLSSVVAATSLVSTAIREHIENEGLDFLRTMMLLPHWLAVEMDWDFRITP